MTRLDQARSQRLRTLESRDGLRQVGRKTTPFTALVDPAWACASVIAFWVGLLAIFSVAPAPADPAPAMSVVEGIVTAGLVAGMLGMMMGLGARRRFMLHGAVLAGATMLGGAVYCAIDGHAFDMALNTQFLMSALMMAVPLVGLRRTR